MDFGAFLGNDALKRRLQESFRQGKTSHCYLLCGVEGSGQRTLALQMAAALECKDERNPGCGVCPACRKVLAKQHPDVITVDDTEHKNVAVDIVRQARSDVFIRPNEGRKKVYIIPRGQDLGAPSQNALLKILEEPPEYAVFLILTTSAEKLLPTIRSYRPFPMSRRSRSSNGASRTRAIWSSRTRWSRPRGILVRHARRSGTDFFCPRRWLWQTALPRGTGLLFCRRSFRWKKISASKFCRFWSRRGGFCAWPCAREPEALSRETRCRRFCAEERARSFCRRPRRCKRRRMI